MKVKNSGKNSSVKSFFNRAVMSVDRSFRASAFYNFFHSYYRSEINFENSFFYNLFNKNSFSAKRRIFKNTFAKQCESSLVVNGISGFYQKVLTCKIRAFAIISMIFSLYSLLIVLMKYTLNYTSTLLTESAFLSLLIFIVSLIFIPVRSSLPEFSSNSKIITFIRDSFFDEGKNEYISHHVKAYMPSFGSLFIIGTILGILTLTLPIKNILFVLIYLFITFSLFRTPENGLPFIILILPFCSVNELCLFSLTALAAYIYKVSRGKRSFSFRYFDLLIFLFSIVILSGAYGAATPDTPSGDAVIMLILILMYFLARNCVKTELMLNKIFNSMSFAGSVVALSYILSKFAISDTTYTELFANKVHFSSFFHETFSGEIAMGEFILLLIPIAFTTFSTANTNLKKTFSFIALLLCISAIISTQSKGLVAALFVTILIYIAASFRSPVTSLVTVAIVCIGLSMFITTTGSLGNDRFFFINDYKANLWSVTTKIFSDNLISGIGFGKENFSAVFSVYNNFSETSVSDCYNWYIQLLSQIGLSGFIFYAYISLQYFKMQFNLLSQTRHRNILFSLMTISAICSVFSMYIRGITSCVWNEPKVFFVFFVILGISTSIYHTESSKRVVYEKES